MREIDLNGRIAALSNEEADLPSQADVIKSLAYVLPRHDSNSDFVSSADMSDQTEELQEAFWRGYRSAVPSEQIVTLTSQDALQKIVSFALSSVVSTESRIKTEICLIPFKSLSSLQLRELRGAVIALLGDVCGSAHLRLGREGYTLYVSLNKGLIKDLLNAGVELKEVKKLIAFCSAGFGRNSETLFLENNQETVSEIIKKWDPEIIVGTHLTSSLNLRWRVNYSLGGLSFAKQIPVILKKQNSDLPNLLTQAEKSLSLPKGSIGFAGIKDKRGVTYQWLTIPESSVFDGIKVFNNFQSNNHSACVAEFDSWKDRSFAKLRQGNLLGNHFSIIVRDCLKPVNDDSIEDMNANGFVNYFGPQRFGFEGEGGISRHVQVGGAIIDRNWRKVVQLLLNDHMTINPDFEKAVNSEDWDRAVLYSPESFQRISILKELARGGDYLSAIRTMPKTLLHLIPASVVSCLWNAAAGKVLEKKDFTGLLFEEPWALPVLGIQQLGKCPLLELGWNSARWYRSILSDETLNHLGISDSIFSANFDFSDDFGFNCRLTSIARPLIVRPKLMKVESHQIGESKYINKFKFILPSSSYASCMLREFM